MTRNVRDAAIVAIRYQAGEPIDTRLSDIVAHLRQCNVKLEGFVQRLRQRENRSRCDMLLEDLGSGQLVDITEDRGPLSRGCRLDVGALLAAMAKVRNNGLAKCDLLVINKFGKTEAEGGGFRPLVADALERGVKVLIAVPATNLIVWQQFAGDMAVEFDTAAITADPEMACRQLGLI